MFDILPLIVQTADGEVSVHEVPKELAHEVEIEHPTNEGLAELGLRWWGFPSICDNVLSIGGINYPLAPFTGWYLAPEISARDFSDTYRYNLLPEIATALGIDTSDVRSLWKDRVVIELTSAVLHSFDKAGIRMDDHHTAAQKFHKWTKSEEKKGCPVEAEWAWMVPPISASLSPNFHREFEDVFKLPALIRRPALGS
jgi:nitric-oxide synthase